MNIHIEPRFNGAGMQELDDVIIGEELFWGCSAMATAILANNLALAPVLFRSKRSNQKRIRSTYDRRI